MEKLVNIAQMNIDYLCSAEANRDGVTIKEMEAFFSNCGPALRNISFCPNNSRFKTTGVSAVIFPPKVSQ